MNRHQKNLLNCLKLLDHYSTAVSFSTFLEKSYDFLTGKSEEKPAELDRKALEHLSQIVEPIAKDNGSQLNTGTIHGNVYYVTSAEANQAQNTTTRLLRDESTSATKYYEKVLLYWHQARNNVKSKAGDKGIIESISEMPIKVICMKNSLKSEMILDIEHPFKEVYILDEIY